MKAANHGGRSRRRVENDEFIGGFLERVISAAGRRVAAGDPEALGDLVALAARVDAAVQEGVDGLRAQGYSWAAIGVQLGVTKQTAHERFRGSKAGGGTAAGQSAEAAQLRAASGR